MSSGKTCLRLQMTDLPYFDLIASGTDTAIYDDFPAIDLLKRKQDEERRAFIYEQVLPEGTKVNGIYPANYYMISAPKRNILLKYDDISGEECINMDWNSSILNASAILFSVIVSCGLFYCAGVCASSGVCVSSTVCVSSVTASSVFSTGAVCSIRFFRKIYSRCALASSG